MEARSCIILSSVHFKRNIPKSLLSWSINVALAQF